MDAAPVIGLTDAATNGVNIPFRVTTSGNSQPLAITAGAVSVMVRFPL